MKPLGPRMSGDPSPPRLRNGSENLLLLLLMMMMSVGMKESFLREPPLFPLPLVSLLLVLLLVPPLPAASFQSRN
jgi:hypothetical protein